MKTALIILFLSFVTIGCSLKCYQCVNCEEGKLGDPVTCTTGLNSCSSITVNDITSKSCSMKSVCEKACRAAKKAKTGDCSCCETDGCNGSVSTSISTLAVLVPVVAAIQFFFWRTYGGQFDEPMRMREKSGANCTSYHSDKYIIADIDGYIYLTYFQRSGSLDVIKQRSRKCVAQM